MSDPGVNAQQFLRLFLGGGQQGADVFQQRQSRAQDKAPDLLFTLMQMQQRQRERQEDVGFRERAFDTEQEQASAARVRQGNIDIANQFQQMRQNVRADQQLKLQQRETDASIAASHATLEERKAEAEERKAAKAAYGELGKQYPKLAPFFGAVAGGANPSSLGPLLNQIGSLTGNETLDRMVQKGFDDLMSRTDAQGVPIPVTAADFDNLLTTVKQAGNSFNKSEDGVSEPVAPTQAVLQKMGDISAGKTFKNSKGMGRLNVDEALQALAMDEIFDPSESMGNDLAVERARDLFDEGFIDLKTWRELLNKMGMQGEGRHPLMLRGSQ